MSPMPSPETLPIDGPVLVTGAGGFVGGHVARGLMAAGCRVRGWSRNPPPPEPGDEPFEWVGGDLRDPNDCARALQGMRAVVHVAGWVSLGGDPKGASQAVNVEGTRTLLDLSRRAGVERFLFTSTLWTVAAGSRGAPADEETPWNLERVRGPYCDTKREAEALVLSRSVPGFRTAVICPGLVIGPRDRRPTSTRLLLQMAGFPVAILPRGGIPVVDAGVLAWAHLRALQSAEPGRRYVVAGPFLSYHEMAGLVAQVAGRPRRVVTIADRWERPLTRMAGALDRWMQGLVPDLSAAAVAGGFLRLHVSGARADAAFGLTHPTPVQSIHEALEDHKRSGRAPWLRLRTP